MKEKCEHLYKQTWRFDNKVEYTCLKCDDWLKLVSGNEVLCRECSGKFVYDKEQKVFYCKSCNKLPYQDELDDIQENTNSMEEKLEDLYHAKDQLEEVRKNYDK